MRGVKIQRRLTPFLFWTFISCNLLLTWFFSWGNVFLLPTETRYLAVAWNLWQHWNYLVLQNNQRLYLDKPPFYFALLVGYWHIVGYSSIATRFFSVLIAALNLVLCFNFATLFWQDRQIARRAVIILSGLSLWVIYEPLMMLDILLSASVLLASISYWRNSRFIFRWLLWVLGNALGLLIKGPVVLVFTVTSLLVFYFLKKCTLKELLLYFWGVLCAFVPLGLWLLLLADHITGTDLKYLVFYQTVERIRGMGPYTFVLHLQPFWWYLPWIPLLFFPWFLHPRFWNKDAVLGRGDKVLRYLLWSSALSIVVFSFFSGKNLNYLVPLFPFIALIIAKIFSATRETQKIEVSLMLFSFISVLIISMLFAIYARHSHHSSEARAIAYKIKTLQHSNRSIALLNLKQEDFEFYGKLSNKNLWQITPAALKSWCSQHPTGSYVFFVKHVMLEDCDRFIMMKH